MDTRLKTHARRSGTRTAALVAGLTLAAGLAACSSDDGDGTATDPAAATSTPSPTETPSDETSETGAPESGAGEQTTISATGSAGVSEATVVSQTEGGGSASEMAFALDTNQAVSDFTMELENGFGDTVAAAAADVAQESPDATPYGAIVSVGCEAPRSVAIEQGEAGFQVVPAMAKSKVQCLAPMTYVVVFAAPDA